MIQYIAGTLLIGIILGVGGVFLYFRWKIKKEIKKAKEFLNIQNKSTEVKNDRRKERIRKQPGRRESEVETADTESTGRREHKEPVEKQGRDELPDFSEMVSDE